MTKFIGIIIAITLPFVSCSQDKEISGLQKKYEGDKSFVLNISGNFSADSDDPEFDEIIKKIVSLKIVAVDKSAKGYSKRDLRRLKEELQHGNLEEVMSVKSGKGNLKVMVKDRKGKVSELVFLADHDDEGFVAIDVNAK